MSKADGKISKLENMLINNKEMLKNVGPEQRKNQTKSWFDNTFCEEWQSVAYYINHPDADLLVIAEIYQYAPLFVETQPSWEEINKNEEWQSMLSRSKRRCRPLVITYPHTI
jgi:hypothetical protein